MIFYDILLSPSIFKIISPIVLSPYDFPCHYAELYPNHTDRQTWRYAPWVPAEISALAGTCVDCESPEVCDKLECNSSLVKWLEWAKWLEFYKICHHMIWCLCNLSWMNHLNHLLPVRNISIFWRLRPVNGELHQTSPDEDDFNGGLNTVQKKPQW
jgi:hypothetical protein